MDEDEKIKVWKDEAAMHGYIIKDEVKVKDLKKLLEKKEELEDMDFVRYEEHDDIDYKKHLKKFFKGEK
jgi:hypothetical protein|tara:strand:+ start:170 stop:376 length:207 start_codon:yes stop_codon:yes gene_type:complete